MKSGFDYFLSTVVSEFTTFVGPPVFDWKSQNKLLYYHFLCFKLYSTFILLYCSLSKKQWFYVVALYRTLKETFTKAIFQYTGFDNLKKINQ